MGSASLINPLTSSLFSPKSELTTPKQFWVVGPISKSKSIRYQKAKSSSSFSVVCKAVSAKPQTAVEGLNIAEDVTQVITIWTLFVQI
jgi:cysteine synthase A